MTKSEKTTGRLRRLWTWIRQPSASIAAGSLLVVGVVAGVVAWGSFNWAMDMTNNEPFCISCHEMRENVYVEYRTTKHYTNRTGVRATCPDCHVPKGWFHKVVRKVKATNELFHHFAGSVSSPQKFNAKRVELATNVWRAMKTTDSRECRNCHNFNHMDLSVQESRASRIHQQGLTKGGTCIDCHRGIAHTLPEGTDAAVEALYKELGYPVIAPTQ